jgi:sulfide:quinone oxidoreductase
VPPSPDTSAALVAAFAERGIDFQPGRRVAAIDPARKVARYDDGGELPFDLFLGVPRHRAPDVVLETGMAVDGYIPVDSRTLESSAPGVYALGDCATVGVPKAGVFSEGQAGAVARALIARFRDGGGTTEGYPGTGSCYIEFGADRIGRVDVDFLSGPKPTGTFQAPSHALRVEKDEFGASRRRRWFGL